MHPHGSECLNFHYCLQLSLFSIALGTREKNIMVADQIGGGRSFLMFVMERRLVTYPWNGKGYCKAFTHTDLCCSRDYGQRNFLNYGR